MITRSENQAIAQSWAEVSGGGIEPFPVSFPKKEVNLLERERHDTSKQRDLTPCTCPDEVSHRFRETSEQAAWFRRNGWPTCVGISGRHGSEYAAPD